ncbi:MAG: phosphorylase, partial [Chitinophagaceae bacterium]
LTIVRMCNCGGLQPEITTDGLIASSHGLGLDNVMHYYKLEQTREEDTLVNTFVEHAGLYKKHIVPYIVQGNQELLQSFIKAGYFHGITATCPGFYAPQGRTLRIPVTFPNLPEKLSSFQYKDLRITNFEMETSAIYGLGKLMGHHCLSINTVVANRSTHQFSKDGKKAVENMITKSLEVLLSVV